MEQRKSSTIYRNEYYQQMQILAYDIYLLAWAQCYKTNSSKLHGSRLAILAGAICLNVLQPLS
jgi:hypothetical protein